MVYVGESGRFTCNTGSTLYPVWQIGGKIIFPEHSTHNESGIYIPMLNMTAADHSSTLVIEGSIDNNNTIVKCAVYTMCCNVDFSMRAYTFTLMVYGELQIECRLCTLYYMMSIIEHPPLPLFRPKVFLRLQLILSSHLHWILCWSPGPNRSPPSLLLAINWRYYLTMAQSFKFAQIPLPSSSQHNSSPALPLK